MSEMDVMPIKYIGGFQSAVGLWLLMNFNRSLMAKGQNYIQTLIYPGR